MTGHVKPAAFRLASSSSAGFLTPPTVPCLRKDAVWHLQPPRSRAVGSPKTHEAHEEAVSPQPGPDDRANEEETKLRKELKITGEERQSCQHGSYHATQDTDSNHVKGLLEFLYTRLCFCMIKGMGKVNDVVNCKSCQDSDANGSDGTHLISCNLHHCNNRHKDAGD
mmetsp:Transcript_95000/g.168717  ORF Transcript_95000/g.168717 Transcript_95000/m.168717 type:complete len:167 (-) Transcript_95000:635-1135(-)